MSKTSHIILAVESAICGGSISLLKDDREAANWIGSSNVSKAEDLLANIDEILTTNDISRHDIDLIAVAAGPGSFTGIRIGLATAMGLVAGLGIKMASESALKAMTYAQPPFRRFITAVSMGRDSVCFQELENQETDVVAQTNLKTCPEAEFLRFVQSEKDINFLLHESLYQLVEPSDMITNFGANVACAIGLLCSRSPGVVTEPLFISKSI